MGVAVGVLVLVGVAVAPALGVGHAVKAAVTAP